MNWLTDFLKKSPVFVWTALLVIWISSVVAFGDRAYYSVLDNLDGEVPVRVAIAQSGHFFAGPTTPVEIFGTAMPRAFFPNACNVTNLLFYLLPPVPAIALNYALVHGVAFVAMLQLLRRICSANSLWLNGGIALAFATLPFYSIFGLTIAAQPWVALATLNLFRGPLRVRDLATLGLYPFWASLPLGVVFVIAVLLAVLIGHAVYHRRAPLGRLVLGIVLMAAAAVIAEFGLLSTVSGVGEMVSHRTAWQAARDPDAADFVNCCRATFTNFISGHYLAPSSHLPILVVAIVTWGLLWWSADRTSGVFVIPSLLGTALLFSGIHGFQDWSGLIALKERVPFLMRFQFGRFHWLHPLIWYVLFGVSMMSAAKVLRRWGRRLGALCGVVLAAQILWVGYTNREYSTNLKNLVRAVLKRPIESLTLRRFYAAALFDGLEAKIGRPRREICLASVGLVPGIARFNGFRTVDFYMVNYPLSYHRKFRPFIAGELAKSPKWQPYYDFWGSRCYTFTAEIEDFYATAKQNRVIKDCRLDAEVFESLGGTHLVSAAEILGPEDSQWRLLARLEAPDLPWRLWLYEPKHRPL